MELTHIARRSGQLSSFLRGEMGMSLGLINRLKWEDHLLVNKQPVHTNFPVNIGDEIRVELIEPKPEYPAEAGDLTILYEDEHLLAVDKPAGMLVHPSRSKNTGTLANYVLGYYGQTGQGSAIHPLTRLDRDTFGLVLLAKNSHVHSLLQNTPVQKEYHAVTFGRPAETAGEISAPIARLPLPSLLRRVQADGKPSITRFRLLDTRGELARLALQPITGRTHQLRVHCAYRGFPILGDPQYGSEESLAISRHFGLTSQLLCAKKLTFAHPITGEWLEIESQLHADYPGEISEPTAGE